MNIEVLMKQDFWKQLKASREIPALPDLTLKILSTIEDSSQSLNDAVALIKQDPSLVMRIMKVANSVRYGGRMKISALEIAAGRLGMSLLKQITLLDGLTMVFQASQEKHLKDFWSHSLSTAFLTEELYRHASWPAGVQKPNKIECFTAAIIHKMGFLFMLSVFESEMHRLLASESLQESSILELELEAFGHSHEELSAYLCERWNLPEALYCVSFFHSNYTDCPEEHRPLCALVYLAAYISRQADFEGSFKEELFLLDKSVWQYLGIAEMDEAQLKDLSNKALAESLDIL